MYEHKSESPIPRNRFYKRLIMHIGVSLLVVMASMGVGITGFMYFENYTFPQSALHSAILLSGLGLVESPDSVTGKIFVSIYSLYAGLVFLVAVSVVFAPAIHRFMHKFHWQAD